MSPSPQPNPHDKFCTLCQTPRSVLVRCQIDATQTWHFVCPGACWRRVSGGEEDARGFEAEFPHYRYGGMWKNKHVDAGKMSAKKPRAVKERQRRERAERAERAEGPDREAKNVAGGDAEGKKIEVGKGEGDDNEDES